MSTEECIALFTKITLKTNDYGRMIDNECNKINTKLSYDQFLEWNIKCIIESSDEDRLLFKILANNIINNKIGQMDLESCAVFKSVSLFYDSNKRLIIVNPR
jgi:hypothetical protein